MRSESLLGLVLGVLSGCGPGIHDLSLRGEPVATLRAHVDVAKLGRKNPDAPLVAVLLWAAVPRVHPVCVAFDNAKLKEACPDPYGVFPGAVEQVVKVGEGGDVAFPLDHVPAPAVLVSTAKGQIVYGTVVVAEDVDANGQFDPVGDPSRMLPDGSPFLGDVVLGASFATLKEDQQRLAYVEGGFDADNFYYPLPGCSAPPEGYSVVASTPYDAAAPARSCSVAKPAEATLAVRALQEADAQALTCRMDLDGSRRFDQLSTSRPNPGGAPVAEMSLVCLSHEVVVGIIQERCPRLIVIALKGCSQDPFCLHPEWDDTASPPAWWPC